MKQKVAIIGSRNLKDVDIAKYIPRDISVIISGGARGIDSLAERYADENGIEKLIVKPDYIRYGKNAPLIRNKTIVEMADLIVAIWDGVSNGTRFVINYAKKINMKIEVVIVGWA